MKIQSLCFFLLLGFVCHAQTLQELNAESTQAYQEKDFPKFLSLAEQVNAKRPSHPTYTYNLACAYALNGKTEKAIETLKHALLMNNQIDFEDDPDLVSVKSSKSYPALLRLKSGLGETIANSEKVVSLSEKELHPEGLAYLPKANLWLATSIRKGKIVSFDIKTGKCTDWLNEPGLFSVFSMKADAAEKYLWVSTSAMPEQQGFSKENEGKGEILKVDIQTRQIVKRFLLEGNHVFGDLAIAKNGIVYVSDSWKAGIYKIENDQISEWLNLEKEAFNLQGITFNQEQDKIYIADYLKGILEVNIATKQTLWMKFPEGTIEKGIDGLLWHDGLIAIHNGVKPIRIINYSMNQSSELIAFSDVIDQNRPEFDEPAMGIVVGNAFYFFANNPWKGYDENYNLDESRFGNPVLYRWEMYK